MRPHSLLTAFAAATTAGSVTSKINQKVLGSYTESEKYLIELAPGQTRWVEEDDKWALRRVCCLGHADGPLETRRSKKITDTF